MKKNQALAEDDFRPVGVFSISPSLPTSQISTHSELVPDILIVDDRLENLIALEALLESCDARITRATSGNEALAQVLKTDFALILLDVQMPDMDGYEVAEFLRGNPQTRSVPIIFVSAISKEEKHIFKGYESGAVDFLAKPIEPLILCGKVSIFLDLWRQRCELEQLVREKVELGQEMEIQAQSDALTGLSNRTLFKDRIRQAILSADRSGNPGALMFIDLDHFKPVNDQLGHEAGDLLLVETAKRLVACVRKSDSVFRIGGDEFVVLAPNIEDKTHSEFIAAKIIEEISRPFQLGIDEARISASVGVAIFPSDAGDDEELLRCADMAMYFAKQSGRGRARHFSSEMNTQAEHRLMREGRLRTALENDELFLHYQPKIDLTTGQIVGTEALARWHPEGQEAISPSEFIATAEETGLIVPLTKWVLETACRQAQQWCEAGFSDLRMAVNISARQFQDRGDLLASVANSLAISGLSPENLELEVTETTVMADVEAGKEILHELQDMGVHISIDDFGTGHSSLSSLKQFPIQTLKIDRSFISDLSEGTDDAAITSAIISMAHKLSLRTIAEGVETQEQLEFLRQNGCDEVQGYLFSPPVAADQYFALMEESRSSKRPL